MKKLTPDDIRPGIFITFLQAPMCKYIATNPMENEFQQKQYEAIGLIGTPFEVKGIDLPFVLLEQLDTLKLWTFDTRCGGVIRELNKDYIDTWKKCLEKNFESFMKNAFPKLPPQTPNNPDGGFSPVPIE